MDRAVIPVITLPPGDPLDQPVGPPSERPNVDEVELAKATDAEKQREVEEGR